MIRTPVSVYAGRGEDELNHSLIGWLVTALLVTNPLDDPVTRYPGGRDLPGGWEQGTLATRSSLALVLA